MAYAFFSQLRKSYPDAWIAVVCTEWVKDIQYKGFVDEIFVLPKVAKKTLVSSFLSIHKTAKNLKAKGPWDLGILLPNSFGSAYLFFAAGVKQIRGYQADLRSIFLSQKLTWNPDSTIHRSDSYLQLLKLEGLEFQSAKEYLQKFDPVKHWPDSSAQNTPKTPYVVIAPGAVAESRRWNVRKFAQLIASIQQQWGVEIAVVGGPSEKIILKEISEMKIQVLDYVAKGSVSSLWKLFQNSKFVVSNDSGLAHVASICGAKVQIIWGAGDPSRTMPLGPGKVKSLTNTQVSCWPCEKNICQFYDERRNQCHEGISSERVMESIERVLNV